MVRGSLEKITRFFHAVGQVVMEIVDNLVHSRVPSLQSFLGFEVEPYVTVTALLLGGVVITGFISKIGGALGSISRLFSMFLMALFFPTSFIAAYKIITETAAFDEAFYFHLAALSLNTLFVLRFLFSRGRVEDSGFLVVPSLFDFYGTAKETNVDKAVSGYYDMHGDGEEAYNKRKTEYATMINYYYDLVTDFYEYGWGQSFHFAPRYLGEGFQQSLERHELCLASAIGLRPGMKCIDVGCGVGGPMRAIAKCTGASVVGINNNDYQIERGNRHNVRQRLDHLCSLVKGDFNKMPFDDCTFDAGFAVEATCHAPDKHRIYGEIFRVLKPGATFACYEWCMTDLFDPNNKTHQAIKKGIEVGDALPDIDHYSVALQAMKDVGFEVAFYRDMVAPDTPVGHHKLGQTWYLPLSDNRDIRNFRASRIGRAVTQVMVYTLEKIGLAPKGSYEVSNFLEQGAANLVKGGETGIFTPAFMMVVRKPCN